jgi:hypothetical protein
LTALLVIAAVARQCLAADVPRLEVQTALFYRSDGHRSLIKRLDPGQAFQGRAITRDGRVFLAYDGPGSEASTVLSIYDVNANRESVIVEIGGTGDAEFSYDVKTNRVVFNWVDGLYLFSLDAAKKIAGDRDPLAAFKRIVVLVKACKECSQPHWIADSKIEYLQYGKDGEQRLLQIAAPQDAPLPRQQ